MYNKAGDVVNDVKEMFGRPTKNHMVHPEMLIFVYKTGCNTSQISDGNIGGRKVIILTKGSSHGTVGSTTNHHFTVLPFISGTGAAVMCAIILQSEKKSVIYHGRGNLVSTYCMILKTDMSRKCLSTTFTKQTHNFKGVHVVLIMETKFLVLSVHLQNQAYHQSF